LIERWITPEHIPAQKDLKRIEKERKQQTLGNSVSSKLSGEI
jgi:hypothetical protein